MGVLKNDVGRPSNKTIKTRFILKLIGLILVVGLSFAVGYKLSNIEFSNEENKTTNETSKKDNTKKTISEKDAEKMIVDIFGEDYHIYTYAYDLNNENVKSLIAVSNTKKSEKTYDIVGNFESKYDDFLGKYVYEIEKNIDENGVLYYNYFTYTGIFIEYDDANKIYKKFFGNKNELLKDNIFDFSWSYFYSKDLNVYAIGIKEGGDEDKPIGGIVDAYELNDKVYITVAYFVDEIIIGECSFGSVDLTLIDGSTVTLTCDELKDKNTYKKYKDKLKQRQLVFFKEDNLYKFEQVIEK